MFNQTELTRNMRITELPNHACATRKSHIFGYVNIAIKIPVRGPTIGFAACGFSPIFTCGLRVLSWIFAAAALRLPLRLHKLRLCILFHGGLRLLPDFCTALRFQDPL